FWIGQFVKGRTDLLDILQRREDRDIVGVVCATAVRLAEQLAERVDLLAVCPLFCEYAVKVRYTDVARDRTVLEEHLDEIGQRVGNTEFTQHHLQRANA